MRWAVLSRVAAVVGGLAAIVLITVVLVGGPEPAAMVAGVLCACGELLAGVLAVAGWIAERRSAAAADAIVDHG